MAVTGKPQAEAAAPPPQVAKHHFDRKRIARIVSLVLHPFLVSILGIILILYLDTGSFLAALMWAGLCALFVVAPALIYLRQKLKQKKFTDADVSIREQRHSFYIFGATCMLVCFGVLLLLDAPRVMIALFVAALVTVIVAAIATRFWSKVSIHAGVVVGIAAAAAFYSIELAVILAVASMVVSWSRLVLKRHTAGQAVAGWAIAIICTIAVFGALR